MPTPSRDSPEKRRRSGPIAALVVAGLLVLYVLSTDLANMAVERGFMPQSTYNMIYAPLIWLVELWAR